MKTRRLARAASRLGLLIFTFAAALSCAAQPSVHEDATPLYMFATVTVTDRNQAPVPGLPLNAFHVWERKEERQLTHFVAGDEPASVAILFDLSDSVRVAEAGRLKDAIWALSSFVREGNSSNEYFVFTFANDVSTLLDGSRDTDAAVRSIRAASGALSGRQHSSFWDACYLALPKLARGANAKRVLILVTDGEDTFSRAREDDIQKLLKETNIVVYSFDVGRPRAGEPRSEGARALERLSKVSGGLTFRPRDAKEWEAEVSAVEAELRSQYVLGFKPSMVLAAGQCLNVKIRLTSSEGLAASEKDLVVRSREQFCAPRADVGTKKSQ